MTKGTIISLQVGLPKMLQHGFESAIDRTKVESVFLSQNGFEGDQVANTTFHGGPDRAVCIYPYEHYEKWEHEYDKKLPVPSFGENITVAGLIEEDVHIGDTFQVGEAIIQVTQGRVPCDKISRFNQIEGLLKQVLDTGYTGYLCRVLKEGIVKSDDELIKLEIHSARVSVLYANQVLFHDQKNIGAMENILSVSELADDWKDKFSKRVGKLK